MRVLANLFMVGANFIEVEFLFFVFTSSVIRIGFALLQLLNVVSFEGLEVGMLRFATF